MMILVILMLIIDGLSCQVTVKSAIFQTLSQNVTLILKSNEAAVLKSPFRDQDKASKWLFGTPNGSVLAIYKNERLLERLSFECEPYEYDCASLRIPRIDYTYVGEYKREGEVDNSKTTNAYFYVSVYETPFIVSCSDPSICRFNYTNSRLSVRANEPISFSIATNVWQNNGSETHTAEFLFNDRNCDGGMYETRRKLIKADASTRLQQIELKKECTRKFNQDDLKYQFDLNYANNVNDNRVIDTLKIDLDVHYGPEKVTNGVELSVNKTQGQEISLRCPFNGNPIDYFWKVTSGSVDTTEFSASQIYSLPKNLSPGTYTYQCRAYLGGFIQRQSEFITFYVRISPPPTLAPKIKNNLGGIIGGAVGGTLGLIVIILVILLIIRYKRRLPKDEVDKAKDKFKTNGKPMYKGGPHTDDLSIDLGDEVVKEIALNGKLRVKREGEDDAVNKSELRPLNAVSQVPPPILKRGNLLKQEESEAMVMLNNVSEVSPSNAEARLNDAASRDANLSTAALKSGSQKNLTLIGGYKVLPTEEPLVKTKNPGESPPSYDTALQQHPNEQSPRLLTKQYQKSQTTLMSGSNGKIHTNGVQYEPSANTNYMNSATLYNQTPIINNQVQYTDVMTLNSQNRARTRGPLATPLDQTPQTPTTQYSSVSQFTLPPASHV